MFNFSTNREAMDWIDAHAERDSLLSVLVNGSPIVMNRPDHNRRASAYPDRVLEAPTGFQIRISVDANLFWFSA